MKFSLFVNQRQAIDLGITNVNQAHIFDFLTGVATWADAVVVDGEVFYWVSRQEISRELPLLNIKEETVYRHLKSLATIGVIEYKKQGKKDCVRLTEKGKKYYVGNESELTESTISEINPNSNEKLGNKSEKNSDLNPTYPTTSITRTITTQTRARESENRLSAVPDEIVLDDAAVARLRMAGVDKKVAEYFMAEFIADSEDRHKQSHNWVASLIVYCKRWYWRYEKEVLSKQARGASQHEAVGSAHSQRRGGSKSSTIHARNKERYRAALEREQGDRADEQVSGEVRASVHVVNRR